MRAHSVEPTLSWPSDGRRVASRPRSDTSEPTWDVGVAGQPLARVAALLLSISQNNTYEGRDPRTVPDALSSGFVADLLGVDIATLAVMLVDLRRRGLVDHGPGALLQLKDIDGLQQLVN